jgi:RNA polymerase sigma-70 factor (ECF subfamily)
VSGSGSQGPAPPATWGIGSAGPGGGVGSEAEHKLVAALRAGDETAFAALVDAHSPGLLRLAQVYVSTRASAEEVVQDTWLALIERLADFEERSSLKTWLYRVVVNIAKTRAVRERRVSPFSSLVHDEEDRDDEGPTVDPSRFLPLDAPRWPGHWSQPPQRWEDSPEQALTTRETLAFVREALTALPQRQRLVVELRDVHDLTADEVCDLLGISAGNQRVLLHRGRAKIREALEDHLGRPGRVSVG